MFRKPLQRIKKSLFYPKTIFQERKELVFYSQFIKKGDLCFDVGANIGSKTNIFLKLGAKVIAIEPQKAACQKINELYGGNKNLIVVNKGLAKKQGFLELSINDNCGVLSTMSERWKKEGRFSKSYKWTETEKVPVDTLDNLINKYGPPRFCKIDVEGFELEVLKGFTKQIPYISFEFTKEFLGTAKKCVDYLASLGRSRFNFSISESSKMFFKDWVLPKELFANIEKINSKDLWGDIYATFESGDIKLHLGCGSNILPGYINIDKGRRKGIKYDLDIDILDLKFKDESIDEIRLHHVFEHFQRYQAVVLMFVFNNWLKDGGKLIIETPDFEWCCRKYLNLMTPMDVIWSSLFLIKHKKSYFKSDKWKILRHVFGSKEAEWANHLEGWDKFTLSYLYRTFGFKVIKINQSKYRAGPVPSITVVGEKERYIKEKDFKNLTKDILGKMVINDFELNIWLERALKLQNDFKRNKDLTEKVQDIIVKRRK